MLLWARAAELEDVSAAARLEVLDAASNRAPHNSKMLQWFAISNERLGEKAKARNLYSRIIMVSQFDKERAWAQKQADSERLQDNPAPTATPDRPARPPVKPASKPPVKH